MPAARVVVLAASACETARILLNSKSGPFPHGPGQLQRHGRALSAWTPSAAPSADRSRCSRACRRSTRTAPTASRSMCPGGSTRSSLRANLALPRGYHIEYGGGRRMPVIGTSGGLEWLTGGSYGKKFKEDARRYYGSFVSFDGRGEMIPNDNSYCEIDPRREGQVRHSGAALPLAVGATTRSARRRTCRRPSRDIIEAMGGAHNGAVKSDGAKAIAPGGFDHPRGRRHHHGGGSRRPRSPMAGRRPGTSRTSSWPTAACSPPTPTRTRRSPSWRLPGVPPTTSSIACGARSCDGPPHDHQVGTGRERLLAAPRAAHRARRRIRCGPGLRHRSEHGEGLSPRGLLAADADCRAARSLPARSRMSSFRQTSIRRRHRRSAWWRSSTNG